MALINLERLEAMEGDEDESVPLLPRHKSLLIKLIFFFEDNPQAFIEDYDADTMESSVNHLADDIQSRLAK